MKEHSQLPDVRPCVIILNWNSQTDTNRAIDSLKDCPWPITVVDNASTDPLEPSNIRENQPGVKVLENSQNQGYAGGMNVGMKWAIDAGYTHAVLLNPDTLPSKDVIESMISLSEGYAVVGTAQVTEDLSPYVSAAHLVGRKPIPFSCATSCGQGHIVDIVSGAAILINLETASQLDFIDEDFFHYKEEFDFCYRVGMSGQKLIYSCGTPLIHKRGGSLAGTSKAAMYYSYRNELLFLRKHFGRFGWLSGLGLFRNAFRALIKSPYASFAILKGLNHGIRGLSGPVFSVRKVRISR